jgi:hypothetical protein
LTPEAADLIAFAQSEQRVCPLPRYWADFWELLPDRRREGAGWIPPLPLILAGWSFSSDQEKARRLRDHILWAADHGALSEASEFLRSLPASAWHYLDR